MDNVTNPISDLTPSIIRQGQLAEKIVIVDGQGGCGKTMLSPIIAAMDRVEIMNFAFEIEFICRLFSFNKITEDAAVAMVRMIADHKLYQTMMGRETNFRFSDLSSVFRDSNPWRYFRRIFQEGDQKVPEKIRREKPILHLTTHDLLSVSEPILIGLGERATFIELVRHPLYMIKQELVNMETLVNNPRDIQICFEYKDRELPYFARGWEEKFLGSNSMERAIYAIDHFTTSTKRQRAQWNKILPGNIVTVPFELFVVDPETYLKKIQRALGSGITPNTRRVMRRQKVPREMIADGINLDVYKRYSWEPSSSNDEILEFKKRRDFVVDRAEPSAIEVWIGCHSNMNASSLAKSYCRNMGSRN